MLTGKLPQARVGDIAICVGPMDVIAKGSSGVFVNKMPAARTGDLTAHGGVIVAGLPTVIIGETKGGGGGGAAMLVGALGFSHVEVLQQISALQQSHVAAAPFCEICFKKAQAFSESVKAAAAAAKAAAQKALASPSSEEVARKITKAGGSADQADVDLVVGELKKLPPHVLEKMEKSGVTVVASRNSVTDHVSHLKGVRPRGWPPGSSWDQVPGAYMPDRKELVVATIGHGPGETPRVPVQGEGHGSYNVVLHEGLHGFDDTGWFGDRSSGRVFEKAREEDLKALSDYQRQAGSAGLEETYAESGARYYGGDPNMASELPGLYRYWSGR